MRCSMTCVRPKTKCLLATLAICVACIQMDFAESSLSRGMHDEAISLHLADYDLAPRLANGRIDIDSLTASLSALGYTDYYWLIWHSSHDWEDLKLFLPKALKVHLRVWVYLVPPSESPPYTRYFSEPFRLNYVMWALEIAKLSLKYPNLVGWILDDFYANTDAFAPSSFSDILNQAHKINPKLAFMPVLYFYEIQSTFLNTYRDLFNGIIVSYPRDKTDIATASAILKGESPYVSGEFTHFWKTPSAVDDYVQASQVCYIENESNLTVSFTERDDYIGPAQGYFIKQMILNNEIIWEEDLAGGDYNWKRVDVVVQKSKIVAGSGLLSFRITCKKKSTNFGFRWDVKDLLCNGIKVEQSLDFPQYWRVRKIGAFEAGFGNASNYVGKRSMSFVVMVAVERKQFEKRYGEPATIKEIKATIEMALGAMKEGLCEGLVTYCLDTNKGSDDYSLVSHLFRSRSKSAIP